MPPGPKFKRDSKDRAHLLGLDSSDEEEEEIFLNSSPNAPHQSAHHSTRPPDGNHKIRQVQGQVKGVIGVMKDNIGKVLERGEKLEDLEERSGELADSATSFRHSSRKLKDKLWWQQCRVKLILLTLLVLIIFIIIVVILIRYKS